MTMMLPASTVPAHLQQYFRRPEPCSGCFVCHLVTVFRAVRRVLHPTGTVFCNLGDSYSGSGKGPTGATSTLSNGRGVKDDYKVVQRHISLAERRQEFVDQRSDVPGLGPKQLMMTPARVALALQADGWVLRQQIIWAKPNPMPESVTDRCTTSHEYIYLLAKRPNYFFDAEAIKESSLRAGDMPGGDNLRGVGEFGVSPHAAFNGTVPSYRNRRAVWTIATESFEGAHFATFPKKLVEPAVLAGTSARGQCPACGAPWTRTTEREGLARSYEAPRGVDGDWRSKGVRADTRMTNKGNACVQVQTTGWAPTCTCPPADPVSQTVLDPFSGSGTSLWVARQHFRRAIGIELNEEYAKLAADRLKQGVLPFTEVGI